LTNSDLVDLRRRCQVPVGVTMILRGRCCILRTCRPRGAALMPISLRNVAYFPDSGVQPRDALLSWPRLSSDVPELRPPVLALFTLAREVNREFGCHDLLQLCQVKTNARSDQGTYYIRARPGSLVLGGLKACRDTNWRSRYFFFRVDRHSFSSFDPARMTRTWSTNLGQMET